MILGNQSPSPPNAPIITHISPKSPNRSSHTGHKCLQPTPDSASTRLFTLEYIHTWHPSRTPRYSIAGRAYTSEPSDWLLRAVCLVLPPHWFFTSATALSLRSLGGPNCPISACSLTARTGLAGIQASSYFFFFFPRWCSWANRYHWRCSGSVLPSRYPQNPGTRYLAEVPSVPVETYCPTGSTRKIDVKAFFLVNGDGPRCSTATISCKYPPTRLPLFLLLFSYLIPPIYTPLPFPRSHPWENCSTLN